MANKVKKPVKKKAVGRPSLYSKIIAEKICLAISNSSLGLYTILDRSPDLPARTTVFRWLGEYEEFRDLYARAREQQADLLADEIIELADKSRNEDTITSSVLGTTVQTSDNHNRTRLQIDARKWKASKLAPKRYGDKIEQEITGSLKVDISETKFSIKPKGK